MHACSIHACCLLVDHASGQTLGEADELSAVV